MKAKRKSLVLILLLGLCLGREAFILNVHAQDDSYDRRIRRQAQRSEKNEKKPVRRLISKAEAARRAKEVKPGKVLSVQLRAEDSERPFYEVKIASDGKVHNIRVSALR